MRNGVRDSVYTEVIVVKLHDLHIPNVINVSVSSFC